MLLQIDGWYGSGKSVLVGLLDGHPEISPNPIHDATHMALLMDDVLETCNSRDIESLRRLLGKSQYYEFEKYSLFKNFPVNISAGIEIDCPYDLNFYEFDKTWIAELRVLDKWTPEIILEKIYSNYSLYLTGKNNFKYNLSMGWPIIDLQLRMHESFPNAKTIYVRRDVKDLIAVRSGRLPRVKNGRDSFFAPGYKNLIFSGEVEKILRYYLVIEKIIEKFPVSAMMIEFDDLIIRREQTMQKISSFLDVEYNDSMLTWSFLSNDLGNKNFSYTEKINDKADEILNRRQLMIIRILSRINILKIFPSHLFLWLGNKFQFFAIKLKYFRL